ncbi:glycosyltransferase [Paenibacillus mendelii]|uniref:Glycosyltransferase n=1 Tax=Paenibacillus mendelii TaxID=206163 RepID=A0ABV6JJF7_9BACL|nr:glycosyltransferase [Paenibacillus mendelii]MCQ6558976.1 glycosyltransferase [Paenibacillus mendelii]
MKKNLLFVMNNLNCGGAEKALIALLNTIDYSGYNVDLLLFRREGIFLADIPKQVNVLEEPPAYRYFDMPIKAAIKDCILKGRIDIAIARTCAAFIFRSEKNRVRCEQRVWKYMSRALPSLPKQYDAAIGYLEKNPIYYCIEKVTAAKKIGFIHNDYDQLGMDPAIDRSYFERLDHIVTVSDGCVKVLKDRFPMFETKIQLMYNIVSPDVIKRLSQKKVDLRHKGISIVSVGRLHYQKGFEMAVEACAMLIEEGYDIKWYVVGEGDERRKLEGLIQARNLEASFILTGVKDNPYPYIRQCDIYVQTSLFEGHCLTITEAKILQRPIVSTDFNVIHAQIRNEKNGLIVQQDPASIYEGIKRLINDKELRDSFERHLSKEYLGTESEIDKLYQFIS